MNHVYTSDHKGIRVSFGKFSSTVARAKQDKEMHYSKEELEEVAKDLKRFVRAQLIKEWSYENLIELITTELVGVRAIFKRKGKTDENPRLRGTSWLEQALFALIVFGQYRCTFLLQLLAREVQEHETIPLYTAEKPTFVTVFRLIFQK